MTDEALRGFTVSGRNAQLALDWLHVHAEVRGVIDKDDEFVVYLAGALPPLPMADIVVREEPVDMRPVTGLEDDAVIVIAADLIVRPPWVERPADFAGVELIVPRGAAFGSGEHDSTKAALLVLHALWNDPVSCADVGTGSGILALYAATRGCREIGACDIEQPAVTAAQALLPHAVVELGGPELLQPADCVIANMTGAELDRALPAILALWLRRGPLVLSGMRPSEVAGIRSRLPAAPDYSEQRGAFTSLGLAGGAR